METSPSLNNISFNKIDRIARINRSVLCAWLNEIAEREKKKISSLQYNFCSDEYLLEINLKYLRHNTYTDIITFDQSDDQKHVYADIYLSLDRIRENAKTYRVSFTSELNRVLAHGLLHLCGYRDKTKIEQSLMREKENFYLSRLLEGCST